MTRILVTGASGFVGAELVKSLVGAGAPVRAAFRRTPVSPPRGAESVITGDLGRDTDWSSALRDVSAVLHLAGPAHAHHGKPALERAIAVGTARLAEAAERAGVGRFVFVSSIKAAAARTVGRPLTEAQAPAPEDAYGRAKLEAERAVLARGALRPIVLRPPLVHGPRAKANFERLLRLADSPLLLPLGGLQNRRSIIALDSLIAALQAVLAAPEGPHGVFHVADRPALSAGDMIAALRRGLGRPPGLFCAPGLAALLPRALAESLEVDDAAFRQAYGYGPRSGTQSEEALAATAAAWKAAQ